MNPDLVILLVYAWNDMRDNYTTCQGLCIPQETELRPYLDKNNQIEGIIFLTQKKIGLGNLEIYNEYIVLSKLRINKLFTKISGIDQISKKGIKINLDYVNEESWIPFYLKEKENSHYVKSSWEATESILKKLNNFVKENRKRINYNWNRQCIYS